ncbi:hypothetical protein GQ43DRAFT_157644 [Delitschia confertaspora ATCC 74209]|uniref:Uncharacterized protein n=1 Tax=Delitschia confertaspora ATCC 74209 TaxID=1513339 RepID=A0A9P4JFF5_9PLEO|nr:hypothetical protein GQ43DRAFT_157644 [Delitschia confertaspora ATCC 74209]
MLDDGFVGESVSTVLTGETQISFVFGETRSIYLSMYLSFSTLVLRWLGMAYGWVLMSREKHVRRGAIQTFKPTDAAEEDQK